MYFSHQLSGLRSQVSGLLTALVLFLAVSGCATANWPQPEATFYHADTPAQASARAAVWRAKGYVVGPVAFTGSMRPWIRGGELVVLEPYGEQLLHPGMVLVFYRGADTPRCIHLVADVTDKAVYMTGINNRYSDGWIPKSKIHSILREVITTP